jgi:hypothetical protein
MSPIGPLITQSARGACERDHTTRAGADARAKLRLSVPHLSQQSPAAQASDTEFREAVLQIAKELQSRVYFGPVGSPGVDMQTDKDNPPD